MPQVTANTADGTVALSRTNAHNGVKVDLGICAKGVDFSLRWYPFARFGEPRMAATITRAGRAVASILMARPAITFVPWPVVEAFAILRTGPKEVEV